MLTPLLYVRILNITTMYIYMHILNKLFSKIFLVTTNPPNSRYESFVEYYNSVGLNYDLRISTNSSYFKKIYDNSFEINEQEQSLESAYTSILYESYYKNFDSIVILEDDNRFVENFEELFLEFYNNTPSKANVVSRTKSVRLSSIGSRRRRVKQPVRNSNSKFAQSLVYWLGSIMSPSDTYVSKCMLVSSTMPMLSILSLISSPRNSQSCFALAALRGMLCLRKW